MTSQQQSDEGFSMVEVILAMVILAIIAVAMLPALITGMSVASNQAGVATATREVSKMLDSARNAGTRDSVVAAGAARSFMDGRSVSYVVQGTVKDGSCGSNSLVMFTVAVSRSLISPSPTTSTPSPSPAPTTITAPVISTSACIYVQG